MKRKDGAFVVLMKKGSTDEVFLVYRSDRPLWNLPGGGIEIGEAPQDAAVRETFEETGFKIKLSKLLGTYKNIDSTTEEVWNITYPYSGIIKSGIFTPEFPGCKGRWFNVNKLPKAIQTITRMRVKDALVYQGESFTMEFRPPKHICKILFSSYLFYIILVKLHGAYPNDGEYTYTACNDKTSSEARGFPCRRGILAHKNRHHL